MNGLSLFLRCTFVLFLLVAMPLLALPPVSAWIERTWTNVVMRPTPNNLNTDEIAPIDAELSKHDPKSFVRLKATSHNKQTQSSIVDDRFRQIHEELSDIGANYTQLETIGGQLPQFQFECHVPVNNSVYSRTFQHTDADPLVAMQQVLSDVQSWQRSRHRQAMRATNGRR